jgi:hypothetical protein
MMTATIDPLELSGLVAIYALDLSDKNCVR